MKLLLDTCVWGGAVEPLRSAGHDVTWAGEREKDPGDQELLEIAREQGRVLVTLDKDFGELAIVQEIEHVGIVRLVGHAAKAQGSACPAAIQRYAQDLEQGAIVTVELTRVRVRPPGKA